MIKNCINSLQEADYPEIANSLAILEGSLHILSLISERNKVRIDIGHERRKWEYGTAIDLIRHYIAVDYPMTMLDVGSGYSPLCPLISSLYSPGQIELTECEPDAFMVQERKRLPDGHNKLKTLCRGVQNLPEEKYDIVTCISVLEHVSPEVERVAWINLAERVKLGGVLFITVDCVPEKKPYGHYEFDNLRQTNYTPEDIRTRVEALTHLGMKPLGIPDYEYHGNFVGNYTFFRVGMVRVK